MTHAKIKSIGLPLLLLFALSVQHVAAVNNPISYDTAITDCDVIKYNGEYYITGNWLAGDMYASRDLMSWGERKHIFSWSNGWHIAKNNPPDLDISAGHIRYINGTFHYYTQLDDQQLITHATSSNVWGPYVEVDYNNSFAENIDAETFLDEDGQLYFYVTRFGGGNKNYARTMSDPWTLTGSYTLQISANLGWEQSGAALVNEGSKVMKYRGRYYMLYAANHTVDPNYAIGCVEASSPMGFNNGGKYANPICSRATPPGHDEITHIGQPWVVDGLNGFEKWMGYFGETTSEGRTQRIDRMHFFDRKLFIDGPTDRWTPGYHPAPAKPQLLNIFPIADGALPTEDWSPQAGSWAVASEEAVQTDQAAWALNTVNRDAAANYLIEANLKFTQAQDAEDKAGVLAYYQDSNNFVLIGFDRSTGYGADNWYCHVKEAGVDTIYSGGYGGSVDYGVYHKIRVTKNGGNFDIRIDDMIPPNHTTIATAFTGAGLPGIYTDHTAAAFDGIVYTIGWDEYDSGVTGWGNNVGGIPETGSWTTGFAGITMANGTGYIFKGDLMPEFEFAAQAYQTSGTGSMGLAIAVDGSNYLIIRINMTNDQLVVEGVEGGVAISAPAVSVANKSDYNIRAVKLSDKVIVFVDGVEKQSINVGFGPAQAGLYVEGMSARFNGIMAYRTEPDVAPDPWIVSDVGTPGFPGTAKRLDHALYVAGSGADIWFQSDEFAFVQQDISGDWEFTTRVVANDRTHYWAKAGLMFRDSMAQNSRMVHLNVTPRDGGLGGVHLHWRDAAGGNPGGIDVLDVRYPIWIKLKRTGSSFAGSYSTDGQNWIAVGSHTSPVNTAGKVGFSVCPVNNARIDTAVFDRISLKHLAYEAWASGHGLSGANATRTADIENGGLGDGMNNLVEYALGGDPNVDDAATVLPTVGITDVGGGSNIMDYIYNRRLNAATLGLTYGLNESDDLQNAWIYAGTTYETGTVGIDADFESVSNSVPVVGGAGFIQLKVTEQ